MKKKLDCNELIKQIRDHEETMVFLHDKPKDGAKETRALIKIVGSRRLIRRLGEALFDEIL